MKLQFEIKNYRCFSDRKPARLSVQKGIHAFVGPNNSGKSALLKFFYDFRGLFLQLRNHNLLWNSFRNPKSTFEFSYPTSVTDRNEIFFDRNDRDLSVEMKIEWSPNEIAELGAILLPERISFRVLRGTNQAYFECWVNGSRVPGEGANLEGNNFRLQLKPGETGLLSGEAFNAVSALLVDTLYVGPFRNAINIGATDTYFDIQAGQAFIKTWKNFKSGLNKASSEACHALERQIRSIFGYTDLQINALANDAELQVLADGKSYKSSDTGAGLLQFVIVLANAAVTRRRIILIDEPELNLHPTLQLDFLTTIGSYASEGVMFATHSVGLARSAAETIYSVQRDASSGESDVKKFEETHSLTELLGALGFNAYFDLGFSKVLLVEGPTDLKTIQQFLRQLGKEHQVLLLPLGGSSMINGERDVELAEIKRLGARVCALIDSEKNAGTAALSKERSEFREACKKQNIDCHVLELRALENYLSDAAVKSIKGPKYSMLAPYQKLDTTNPAWGKSENWLIARAMPWADVASTDLGRFLTSL